MYDFDLMLFPLLQFECCLSHHSKAFVTETFGTQLSVFAKLTCSLSNTAHGVKDFVDLTWGDGRRVGEPRW